MGNKLRNLRLSHSIPASQMVERVRTIYPKYDKTLQSKCEADDVYGVQIKPKALKCLYMEYDPKAWERMHRKDGHKFKNRVQCRLDDVTYAALMDVIAHSNYSTTQDWLAALIRAALQVGTAGGER